MQLTIEKIKEICLEIDLQWDYHLMTRAVFDSRFPKRQEYGSAGLYRNNGIEFYIKLPEKKTARFEKAAEGIALWLNQNYVIRLYGILDSYQINKHQPNSDIIRLIKMMRNNIGAHSTG